MKLRTKIFRRITEISPEDWNSVFPAAAENYYFFKTLDESGFDQFSFYYLLVYDRETIVGATSCFLMNYPLDTTASGLLQKILSFVNQKVLPGILNLRILMCGLPMGQGRIGVCATDRRRVVQAILEAMEEIARSERVPILAFKDFAAGYGELLAGLGEEGFFKFQSMPSTEMSTDFVSFEEYLKTLSRASREGAKRKFKKADTGVKIEMEIVPRLNGTLDEVYALYLQTIARAEMQFELLPKPFFDVISDNMPGEVKYFLWRIDGRLVAFALCFISGERFVDYYLGFDYSVAYDYHLYFIRFRDLMNWCIRNGMKTYEMGPTGYEPKRRLGFEFVPLYAYAKHRWKWMRPFFNLLCYVMKPENFDPIYKQMEKQRLECLPKS